MGGQRKTIWEGRLLSFTKANGIDVHYRESGAGSRAILFAHALGTSLSIWDAVAARLRRELRCIGYDLRGHGRSTVAEGAYSIGLLSADLLSLMDALDIPEATVCGVSIGGLIAQRAALDAPDRVTSLVLCDTGARIGSPEAWQDRIRLVSERGLPAVAGDITARWFSPVYRRAAAARCDELRAALAAMSTAGYLGACHALRDADLSAEAGNIRAPTLVVCGAEDIATPPAVARDLASAISGARLDILPNVGHLPCVEAPERLAQSINQFFLEANVA